jgi:hypothetical protein
MTPTEDLRTRLPEYAAPFEKHPPEILGRFAQGDFPFAPDSDRGLGILLLSAAVYRPGGEAAAARLVSGLYLRFKNDIFKLNRLPFESLRDAVEALDAVADPAERARVPGILRSACDFFYRVGPLKTWLEKAPDWETRVLELCGEIYWMGRHSVMKNKARYFLWLAAATGDYPQARDFAWPVGEGHLRFYVDFLKPGRKPGGRAGSGMQAFDADKRLATFRDLGRAVFPEQPWRLYAPLDAYLRRGGALQYRCRSAQGGCRPCPLKAGCPAAPHFLAMEK